MKSILAAWKEVVDDSYPTDWTLLSYEGKTDNLKVLSKGEGGIEEMREDLNVESIMYGFCKMSDPGVHKFVLINWTGEYALYERKRACADHIEHVSCMLKQVVCQDHMIINARNKDQVDDIMLGHHAYVYKKQQKPERKSHTLGKCGGGGYTKVCTLSPELAAVVGQDTMARHEVVKKVWSIIKEQNLYDPKNKQFAICNDELLKVFGVKRFRTFGMMKYLKNHFVD